MHRGLEVEIGLRPGIPDEAFVAQAIGNLAGFELQRARGEPLAWQVLRVEGHGAHRYRLIVRHPSRALDVGLGHALGQRLAELSDESVEALRRRFDAARADGLRPVPLRHVTEASDLWQDDFWNWIG